MASVSTDTAFFGHPRGLVDALLHRDVGALQLLRDARAPHPVHDGRAVPTGGLGFDTVTRRRHLRPLHRDGLHDHAAGRLDRRPADWRSGAPCSTAASSSRPATSAWRCPPLTTFYVGLAAHRHRHRAAQRQHQRDRRPAVSPRRHPRAMPGIRSSTWASTSVRSSRRWSADTWASGSAGTRALRAAGVGMMLGLVQYVLGATTPR